MLWIYTHLSEGDLVQRILLKMKAAAQAWCYLQVCAGFGGKQRSVLIWGCEHDVNEQTATVMKSVWQQQTPRPAPTSLCDDSEGYMSLSGSQVNINLAVSIGALQIADEVVVHCHMHIFVQPSVSTLLIGFGWSCSVLFTNWCTFWARLPHSVILLKPSLTHWC